MAGRIALDLKQFKHLKSDDKTHTLQHRDGHTLTLATKALHPDNQKQLSALAEASNSSKKSTDKSEDTQDKQVRGMAEGGDIQDQPESAVGKQIQQDEMMRGQDPMRGMDPNARPVKQAPMPAYNTSPVSPEGIAYGDSQAKQFKDKMGSIVYQPTTDDYIDQALGAGMTHQEMINKAGQMAAGTAGTMAKVPGAAGQMVQGMNVATKALPGRGVGQGVGLIDTAQKGLGKVITKKAGGGEVREYAEGTPDVAPQIPTEDATPAQDFMSRLRAESNPTGEDLSNKVMTEEEKDMAMAKNAMGPEQRAFEAGKAAASKERADSLTPPTPAPQPQEAPAPGQIVGQQLANQAMPSNPQIPPTAGGQPPQTPGGQHIPGMQESANKYFTSQQAGIQGLSGAQQAQAIEQQKAYETQQTALADAANDFKTRYQALDSERKAHIDDIKNGYIDPDKYWTGDKQGNGSHSRLMAGIGMLIAGFNPTSNPNAAIDFVNKQVSNSIEAQKANLSQKNNLLNANLQQFHNIRDAQDMTRIMMNDSVANKINMAAAKASSPQAKAQAQMAMSQLYRQNYDLQMQMGMRSVMMNPSQDPMTAAQQAQLLRANGQTDMANNIESKIVPNVGVAKIPVSAETRSQITAMKVLDDKGREILDYIKKNSGTLNASKRQEIQQKVEEMKNFYNDSIKGGALTEGRLAWYDEQFKKTPTDIIPQLLGNTARLQEMVTSNHSRYNILIGQHGLPQAAATQQATQYNEGQTGKDSNGNPIVFSNGHWRRK